MPRIPLPEGAQAVAIDGSNRYIGSEGDRVTVSPGHADAIRRYAGAGPARGQRFVLGTKMGRRCVAGCRPVWNAWAAACPRCSAPTTPA